MIHRWLEQRRDGVEQDEEEIGGFVRAVVEGAATPAQIGAWLAFVVARGMTARETVILTRAMAESGARLRWPGLAGPFVDKHSTGGIGDKVSLVLAPLWAALGKRVPMLSGRGLGITGGTLDKLESIPGYATDLDAERLRSALEEVGCFINGQTRDLAPADRILYALRDETQTVPSVPLITASILSKKLVEGIEELVLDVKVGSGAFMRTAEEARALARSLQEVGRGAGLEVRVHLSDMEQPLGRAVGNAVEVEEARAALDGGGPGDLVELVVLLSGAAPEEARAALGDGRARARFDHMVRAHGGDPGAPLRGADARREEVRAVRSGEVRGCDAGAVGRAALALGAGRTRAGDAVHHGVGVLLHAKRGDAVRAGEALATLLHAERGRDEARAWLADAFRIE